MQIQIKDATAIDIDDINKLLRLLKAHWEYDENFLNRFMAEFAMTPERLLKTTTKIYYVENKLAGLFGFIFNEDCR